MVEGVSVGKTPMQTQAKSRPGKRLIDCFCYANGKGLNYRGLCTGNKDLLNSVKSSQTQPGMLAQGLQSQHSGGASRRIRKSRSFLTRQ